MLLSSLDSQFAQTVGVQAHGGKVRQLAICFSLSQVVFILEAFFPLPKHCGHECVFFSSLWVSGGQWLVQEIILT